MFDSDSNFLFPEETIAELTVPKMMFRRIQKRDGTIVEFEKQKITNAIFAAAQSVGGKDSALADSLADRVILYLARTYEDGLLNVEQVQDAIEKVLIENGHARTVKSFILYRAERHRVRQLKGKKKEGISETATVAVQPRDLQVRTSEEEVIAWNRQRIIDALVRETQLELRIAAQISKEVEAQIIYSKIKVITAGLIRELVNAKLIEYGFEKERRLHTRLGIPLYDFEQLLFSPPTKLEKPLEQIIADSMYRQYALTKVFSQEVINAYTKGDIYLHQLNEIANRYQLRTEIPDELSQLKSLVSQNFISSYLISLDWKQYQKLTSANLDAHLFNDRIRWIINISESSLTAEIINAILNAAKQTDLRIRLVRNHEVSIPEIVMHKITLNLPRVAYSTGTDFAKAARDKNESYLFQLLSTRLGLIAEAQLQKQALLTWISGVHSISSFKPGSLPAEPQLRYAIGILGLNEMVQSFTGNQLHQSEPAMRLGLKLLNHLHEQCQRLSQKMNLALALEPTYDSEISYRFAKLDLDQYPPFAAQVVKKRPTNGGGYYTLGANLADDVPLDLFARINAEGRFHVYFNNQGYIMVPVSFIETEISRAGKDWLLSFLKKISNETSCRHLLIKK
jgi:anaerobic ribonucleoside-triphosphate reductase